MTGGPIEITVNDADFDAFDRIIDISTRTHLDHVVAGAIAATYEELISEPESMIDHEQRALIVCDRGINSRIAVAILRDRGFAATVSLVGGAEALQRATGDATGSRYARQTRLSGFGPEGQVRLRESTIAVVGIGGLGCPALSVLVPAGVGRVRLIDFDTVDISNLHRQPLFTAHDVGRPKVAVAAERLADLNPDVAIETVDEHLTDEAAPSLLRDADVVIDATDNFPARGAITTATVSAKIPMVYGSIYGFEGQFAVFTPPDGPCYHCVFPPTPESGPAIDCATVGTLGAVTSVIGSLQAAAAIQLASGTAHDVRNMLTMYDARATRFDRMTIGKDPDCPTCSERGTPPAGYS